jgi:hypothetical protein
MIFISPTFLDSFRYFRNAEDEYADKARQDLIDRLNGVSVTSDAMQKGIDFEQSVCDYIDGKGAPEEGTPLFGIVSKISGHVRGASRQVHVSALISPGITVHGYIDFLRGNTIYDVKTTSKYEFPKYLRNCQHIAYMAALKGQGIRTFRYLATDFTDVFVEEYFWRDAMLDDLSGRVGEFLSYLEADSEMKEAFERKQLKHAIGKAAA